MRRVGDRIRVVVTGLGAVSALGHSAPDNWAAALAGQSGIRPHVFESGPNGPAAHTTPAALIQGDVVGALEVALGRRVSNSLDPFSLFGLKVCHEALEHAGLLGAPSLERRTALILGHGFAGIHTLESSYERFYGQRIGKLHPLTIPKVMVSAPVSAAAMEFGVKGPVFAISSACASSGHAIAQAAGLIVGGQVDVALAGGSEAIATPACLRAWEGLQAMSETVCRPFSLGRDGMTIGEGGAAIVLEAEKHAIARGASIFGRLAGVGLSSDAHHWTQPTLEGAVTSMKSALVQAGEIGDRTVLISAHGTGTLLNDENEARAIRATFGAATRRHPVIATKSAHGHLIGASTALQAVIGLKAMAAGLAPPILGWLGADPNCDLDLVLGTSRVIDAGFLMLNAFAFGGLNASIVFEKY